MNIEVNGVSITLTPKQLKHIDAETEKLNKLAPKQRFWKLCKSLTLEADRVKYPDYIFFFKGNNSWFEYNTKNKYLYCSYEFVWSVFEKEFGLKYDEIQLLIKTLVEEYFECTDITPFPISTDMVELAEEYFKRKE